MESIFDITEFEKKALVDLHITTLYRKFFDVDWDNNSRQPVTIAQIRIKAGDILKENLMDGVPVVFITNFCIRHLVPVVT